MADANQYFIKPSGEVGIVKPDLVEEALARGLTPATEEQIKQYEAVKASKAEPLGGVKAFGQALAEGVAALPGIPATAMAIVPSATELAAKAGFADEEAAALARQKRLELAGEMARYTTVPGLQQELGLRTAEAIKAEREAHPYAAGAGTIASFFAGSAASKILKAGAKAAVPLIAAEETLGASVGLTDAVKAATKLPAKEAAAAAARAELAAAEATGDAVEIAAKQAALNEAGVAVQSAIDDGFNLQAAIMAESGAVTPGLAPLVTKEVEVAGRAARKAAQRMATDKAQKIIGSAGRGQKFVADAVKKLESTTLTSPAITSKLGTDLANSVEQRALARLQGAPGFSAKLAEADVAAAKLADEAAVGADKAITGANLAKAEERLATLETRQKLVAKAIGLGLGRSAELMMFGLQGAANEAALGDPALVAESAYANLGFEGGLGAGFGVAEALLPPTLKAGVRAAKAGSQKLSRALGNVYVDLASAVTGAEPETIRAVLAAGERLEGRGLRNVIEETLPAAPTPKPVDYDQAAKELREALQEDVRQIARPGPGGLLYDANTEWRKIQINDTIRKRLQQQTDEIVNALYESKAGEPLTFADEAFLSQIESGEFVSTPYRTALKDLIGRVKSARQIAKTTGMTGEMVPTAQEAAYKVNSTLQGLEDRLVAFEASNPTPEQIFQEMKWVDRELFHKRKGRAVTGKDLSLLNQQMNAAYGDLKQSFKQMVLNKDLWGDAAVLESEWRSDLRAYYAGLDNLKKASKGLIKETIDPKTGLATEIVIDPKKLKSFVKNPTSDEMSEFRNAFKQYLDGRRAAIDRIEQVADYVKASVDKPAIEQRMASTERAYEKAIQNAVDDASNAALKDLNVTRDAKIEAEIAAIKSAASIGRGVSLAKKAVKIGAPVVGALSLSPYGAAAGVAASAITSPIATAKTLAKLNKAKMKMADAVDRVSGVLSGGGGATIKATEALGSFYAGKALRDEYKRVEQRVQKLAQEADALEDQQASMLGDLVDHAPNIADATKTVNATALQYLENARPKPLPGLPPIQAVSWQANDADMRKYLRLVDAVFKPMETLELASTGALLPEQVKALDAVYPSMMQEVRAKLLDRIEQNNKVPAKHRAMVSMLLGKDIDGRFQATRVAPVQAVYAPPMPPQMPAKQRAIPVSRIEKMNVSGRAGQETAAWREAQQGAKLR